MTRPFLRFAISLWRFGRLTPWIGSIKKKENSVQRVLENVKDGDIVLMHDLFFPTAEAAEELIAELSARGFQLVTITELLTYRPETEAIRVK